MVLGLVDRDRHVRGRARARADRPDPRRDRRLCGGAPALHGAEARRRGVRADPEKLTDHDVFRKNSSRSRGFDQVLAAKRPSHRANSIPANGCPKCLSPRDFCPPSRKFARQIVPPVVATLIAAFLIAAYNTTFSGHVTQPRMGGLQAEAGAAPHTRRQPRLRCCKAAEPVTEVITIHEYVDAPERLAEKDAGQEAGKDQSAIKMRGGAAADAAAPRRASRGDAAVAASPSIEPVSRCRRPSSAQPVPRAGDRATADAPRPSSSRRPPPRRSRRSRRR